MVYTHSTAGNMITKVTLLRENTGNGRQAQEERGARGERLYSQVVKGEGRRRIMFSQAVEG